MGFLFKSEENIVPTGENAGWERFLLVLCCFQNANTFKDRLLKGWNIKQRERL